jgi:hypothetical protein
MSQQSLAQTDSATSSERNFAVSGSGPDASASGSASASRWIDAIRSAGFSCSFASDLLKAQADLQNSQTIVSANS